MKSKQRMKDKGSMWFFHASEVRNTRLEFLEQQLKVMVHSLLIPTIIFLARLPGRKELFPLSSDTKDICYFG